MISQTQDILSTTLCGTQQVTEPARTPGWQGHTAASQTVFTVTVMKAPETHKDQMMNSWGIKPSLEL